MVQELISSGHLMAMKALHSVGKDFKSVLENYPDLTPDQYEDVLDYIQGVAPVAKVAKATTTKQHRRCTLWIVGASLNQIARLVEDERVMKQTIFQSIQAISPNRRAFLATRRMKVSDEQVIALFAAYSANIDKMITVDPEQAATDLWTTHAEPYLDD